MFVLKEIIAGIDSAIIAATDKSIQEIRAVLEARIFKKGEDKNETSIGQYSTNPLLIGAKSFLNPSWANSFFSSQEAYTDDTQGFRTLKNGNVAYLLPGGYKKFRSLNGLQNSKVNLFFRGSLAKSIAANDSQIFFSNEYGAKVKEGHEIRFQKRIFAPSEKEAQIFQDNLNEELSKLWKS